jgi:hypothetical protein
MRDGLPLAVRTLRTSRVIRFSKGQGFFFNRVIKKDYSEELYEED